MTALLEPSASTPLAQLRAKGRVRGGLPLLGPAFIASIAYVDPGNFATNFSGGATFGYLLLWVIVAANLMAMLVQHLSAKVGLATGRDLAELCRERYRLPVVRMLWVQAELIAIATDLAEVVGGALALQLLFHLPLLLGGAVTGVVAFALLAVQTHGPRGFRRYEIVVTGLLTVILLGFLVNLLRVHIAPGPAVAGLVPRFSGADSVTLAVGILGATVMPHVIWLHSSLTSNRIPLADAAERRHVFRHQRVDLVVAMGLAGLVNAAMLIIAAALFSGREGFATDTLQGIHGGLGQTLGSGAALAFALALLASGLASSSVGTLAGQVVMQGFIQRRIPLTLRRSITLAPALVVMGLGVDPTAALVISQVCLSFGIPFALIPLLLLTRDRSIMRELVNHRLTTAVTAVVTAVIVSLNGLIIYQTFFS